MDGTGNRSTFFDVSNVMVGTVAFMRSANGQGHVGLVGELDAEGNVTGILHSSINTNITVDWWRERIQPNYNMGSYSDYRYGPKYTYYEDGLTNLFADKDYLNYLNDITRWYGTTKDNPW